MGEAECRHVLIVVRGEIAPGRFDQRLLARARLRRIETDDVRILPVAVSRLHLQPAADTEVGVGTERVALIVVGAFVIRGVAGATLVRTRQECLATHRPRQPRHIVMQHRARIQIEKIEPAGRQETNLGGGVTSGDIAVAPVAVGIEPADVDRPRERPDRTAGVGPQLAGVVRLAARQHAERGRAGHRTPGDDVDHAAHRAVAIAHGAAAAQDFDALDLRQRHRRQIGTGQIVLVQPHAIDQHQHVAGRGRAHAADIDGRIAITAEALEVEVGLLAEQGADGGRAGPLDICWRDDGHAMRRSAQRAGSARCRDQHFVGLDHGVARPSRAGKCGE